MDRLTRERCSWLEAEYWISSGEPDNERIDIAVVYRKLRAYENTGLTPERVQELAEADREGLLVELPCKVGDIYAGICREERPSKKGWKTVSWIETGVIKGFELIAHMTADKTGYDHSRSVEEFGEVWFCGEEARKEAEEALNK